MKGAWCYDGEIKCALGRFYCECGLCCTYSSSPKCVWPCVSLRASQGQYEQSHLGSEHHLLDEGGCLGSGYILCLMQDCPPWQCCAQLPGLGTEGPHAESMGSSGWRFWGQAFSLDILQIFIALEALLLSFLTLESSCSCLWVFLVFMEELQSVWE